MPENTEAAKARKHSYGRDCRRCGARTSGSNGRAKAPLYCKHCAPAQRAIWTRSAITSAIQLFAARYGEPPTSADWNTSQALSTGRSDLAERYQRDGDYPTTGSVQRIFGSWNEGIRAAGYEPLPSGQRRASRAAHA